MQVQPIQSERTLLEHLIAGSRIIANDGQKDFIQGQISGRTINSDDFHIKQALCGFEEVAEEDFLRAPLDHEKPRHKLAPLETPLHQAVYEARPDVRAIVHTHAPTTIIFGATDLEIEPISHDGACFVGQYARFNKTTHTILDIDMAREVAKALGDKSVVFMQNHGVLIVGKSVQEAVVKSIILNRCCEIQLRMAELGCSYHTSPPEDVEKKQEFIFGRSSINLFWKYLLRVNGLDAEKQNPALLRENSHA